MICLAVTYVIRPGHEDRAAEILRTMTALTRTEPGCRFYQAHRSPADPRRFFLYEQYDDQAALDAHRAAAYFVEQILGQLVPIAESRSPELYDPIGDPQPPRESPAGRLPGRPQLSVRALMILVALVALTVGGYMGYQRWQESQKTFTYHYPVGDLIGAGVGETAYEPLMYSIMTKIQPGTWLVQGGNKASITPFALSRSLIVRANPAAHRELKVLLNDLRSRRTAKR